MFRNRWRLVSLGLLAVIGVLAGAVFAAGHGDTEVRINAIRHDDGRVEVGLQQRIAEGEWGDRMLPEFRFLRPNSIGEWLSSSPISIVADQPSDEVAMSVDATGEPEATSEATPVAMPEPTDAPLYCVIHHGQEGDIFWASFDQYLRATANDVGLTNLEVHAEPNVDNQAAAIDDCVARDAQGIASTLPSIEKLQGPLTEARESGAYVVTFNSGAEFASEIGSTVHFGLDDRSAGERAGERFNAAQGASPVLCVVHESGNSGLDSRCEGLDEQFDGEVIRVDLSAGVLANAEEAQGEIADAIAEHEAGSVLVLNAGLIHPAIAAVGEGDTLVGAVGRLIQEGTELIARGELLFQIDDGDVIQAAQVVQGFVMIDQSPFTRGLLTLTATANPLNVNTASILLLQPAVIDESFLEGLVPGWESIISCVSNAGTDAATAAQCFEPEG